MREPSALAAVAFWLVVSVPSTALPYEPADIYPPLPPFPRSATEVPSDVDALTRRVFEELQGRYDAASPLPFRRLIRPISEPSLGPYVLELLDTAQAGPGGALKGDGPVRVGIYVVHPDYQARTARITRMFDQREQFSGGSGYRPPAAWSARQLKYLRAQPGCDLHVRSEASGRLVGLSGRRHCEQRLYIEVTRKGFRELEQPATKDNTGFQDVVEGVRLSKSG